MRSNLKMRRKSYKLTQVEMAKKVGLSVCEYRRIEYGLTFPRENAMLLICKVLEENSLTLFTNDEFDHLQVKKRGDVAKNICNYMNKQSTKVYTELHIKAIRNGLLYEHKDRKKKGIVINGHTDEGKNKIYDRISKIIKDRYNLDIGAKDIWLYKLCREEEYSDRTKKTTWSVPSVRKKLGYNPITGYKR